MYIHILCALIRSIYIATIIAAAESPFRHRPVEENLRLFERMRRGEYAEGAACLRLKMELQSPNPNMCDLDIYR
jgi:glutaminyl-tRNA synthetase